MSVRPVWRPVALHSVAPWRTSSISAVVTASTMPDVAHTNIKMYGTSWCSDCKRAKQFFGEQRVHYDFVDVDADAEGMAYVEQVNAGKQIIPVIRFDDGSTLVEPSNAELAHKLGLRTVAKQRFYDVIVVGSGPAGLT